MSQTTKIKLLITIALLVAISYFFYRYFLKDIYWNNQTQEMHISKLPFNRPIELKKHTQQESISSIEIEIYGNVSENIYLLFGSSEEQMQQQVQIKKGKIDFATVADWYGDNCFLFITSDNPLSVDLTIEYRFIGTSK
jgi:hypothetical protein